MLTIAILVSGAIRNGPGYGERFNIWEIWCAMEGHLIQGTLQHRVSLGGASKRVGRNEEYIIPSAVVEYLLTGRKRATHILPGSERTSEVPRIRVGVVVIGENAEKGKTQGRVISVGVILPGCPIQLLEVLLDTRAMCNLIQKGIPSPHMLRTTPCPMKLVTSTGELF